jgi:hypothetical protein
MIAYLDLVTGLAGDMMIGALLSAGWSEERMREALARIPVPEVNVRIESRRHHSLVGLGIRVEAAKEPPERSMRDVRRIIEASSLDPPVKKRCLQLFERLAGVEAAIHGIAPDMVHFHELGAIDSIVDIVLTVAGIADLGITRLTCGPVPLSRGEVETAHGKLPVPTPATLALLQGIPIRWLPIEGEWMTPTGALILSGLVDSFGPPPEMRLASTGIGAGTRQSPDCPNIVRLLLGDETLREGEEIGWVSIIECDIDDMDPRLLADAVDRMETAGALEVFRTPIHMKKGREGILLTLLCRPDRESEMGSLVLRETTTLGIRIRREFRRELHRWIETVTTPYGAVRIKWSRPGGISRPVIEFDDLRALSHEAGVPAWEVERAVMAAIGREAPGPPPPP